MPRRAVRVLNLIRILPKQFRNFSAWAETLSHAVESQKTDDIEVLILRKIEVHFWNIWPGPSFFLVYWIGTDTKCPRRKDDDSIWGCVAKNCPKPFVGCKQMSMARVWKKSGKLCTQMCTEVNKLGEGLWTNKTFVKECLKWLDWIGTVLGKFF